MDLPSPIGTYFEANARLDAVAMLAPFNRNAVIRYEAQTHTGTHAIRRWIEQASIGASAVAVPQSLRSNGARHNVTAQVSGNFPGTPVTLTFDFQLADDRIAVLEIG